MASQFGPYKLIRQVAVGGMAEIHLAKTAGIAGFEKYVAIKMIHPNFAEDEQFIQMLVDEAKIAVQLTHGNIAQTFDLGRVGETYYITMEYVDGADLYKILRRASEQDIEMPLDVCAFVGKEISSALDHAHRKRDHTGKSLGIVHRDVSPQNVLVSYSGEVKLVDFGIAKATMKARQTAVGVIKGKYYYMSPEQAWGDPIDHRSDIFSAGIVLYEMLTGQMLYLEEDLHKLLEMARAADIAPPSKLRKGVPPQLERIVMHALAKLPADRYQSAGDFATDLERFLHAYSPVFTASKLSSLLRQVVGDPMQVPNEDAVFESIEFRDGVMSTHPLDDSEVAHAIDREELRDENSVIFRISDLDHQRTEGVRAPAPRAPAPPPRPNRAATPPPAPIAPPPAASRVPGAASRMPTPPAGAPSAARPTEPSKPIKQVAPRVTRATDSLPAPPPKPGVPAKIPSISAPGGAAAGASKIPQVAKPRQAHEQTRQLEATAPPDPLREDSGLLPFDGRKLWGDGDPSDDELDNIGEHTVVTAAPGGGSSAGSTASGGGLAGFMMDVAGDDGDGPVEATLITMVPGFGGAPADAGHGDDGDRVGHDVSDDDLAQDVDDDMPTLSGREGLAVIRDVPPRESAREPAREPAKPVVRGKPKAPPPAAFAAKIQTPAVSELRKPRASRRTPPGGAPITQPSVLQAIVSSQSSEPMPAPRAAPAHPQPQAQPVPQPTPPPHAAQPSQPYAVQTPPQGYAQQQPQMQSQHYQVQPQPSQPSQPPQPSMMGQHATQYDPYATPFPVGTPGGQSPYSTDASGLPMGLPTPPGMQAAPGVPNHLQPYLHMQGMPPGAGGYDAYGQPQPNAHGYPQVSPQALYQFQPSQQPMSLTGQMRLFEVDEMPSQYNVASAGRRWFLYIVSGLLAISAAAAATFLIIRATRVTAPPTGSIIIDSVPDGAQVTVDDKVVPNPTTKVTIETVELGSHHTVKVQLPHYAPFEEKIDIPKAGGDVRVIAHLVPVVGKILINSVPKGAEIRINGALKGYTPTTLNDFAVTTKIHLELRLKDYQPFVKDYEFPEDGKLAIDQTLTK